MPKLKRFAKKGEKDPLLEVKDKTERKRILEAFLAMERYVMLALIAHGILQLLCMQYSTIVEKSSFSWLRTNRGSVVSEATMSRFLRRNYFMQFPNQGYLAILQIIRSRMESNDDSDLPGAA